MSSWSAESSWGAELFGPLAGVRTDPLASETRELVQRLAQDRLIFDLSDPRALEILRRDVERIADGMERGSPTPMLWTGIPFPAPPRDLTSDYVLAISVGGTKTEFALLRLEHGDVRILDREGRERGGADVAEVKRSLCFPTPTHRETRSGLEMIEGIVGPIVEYLSAQRTVLDRCSSIVLSWGFANRVVRTGSRVLGGLATITTLMTKEQAAFTRDLAGKDLGGLVHAAFRKHLGWSRPITVANDGIMALHYFLTAENLKSHARFGLFINGTGTNFAAAERYAVRSLGVVSSAGEEYEPRRITRYRSPEPGEHEGVFFVNYETGTIDLDATRTPFDLPGDYPIEENALSGGKAFEQQFREISRERLSKGLHDRLMASWRRGGHEHPAPRGPEVSRMATGGSGAVRAYFPDLRLRRADLEGISIVCRAIVARSALHAALVLAAVTERNGFGWGGGPSGKPDLLAMEGSVWSTEGYPALVRASWQALVGARPLSLDLVHEKSYDASLPGPLYFAVLHR